MWSTDQEPPSPRLDVEATGCSSEYREKKLYSVVVMYKERKPSRLCVSVGNTDTEHLVDHMTAVRTNKHSCKSRLDQEINQQHEYKLLV